MISIDDFTKVDLRVARVVTAEEVPKAKKLLKLTLTLGGDEQRTVFAGIKSAYEPEKLVGRLVIVRGQPGPAADDVRPERRHGRRRRRRRHGDLPAQPRQRRQAGPARALSEADAQDRVAPTCCQTERARSIRLPRPVQARRCTRSRPSYSARCPRRERLPLGRSAAGFAPADRARSSASCLAGDGDLSRFGASSRRARLRLRSSAARCAATSARPLARLVAGQRTLIGASLVSFVPSGVMKRTNNIRSRLFGGSSGQGSS